MDPAAGLVVVDEGRRDLGVLDHDLDVLGGEQIQGGNLHPGYLAPIDAARQDRDPGPEPGGRQRRVEGGAAEDHAAVRLEIGGDVADHQVVRRFGELQAAPVAWLERWPGASGGS